MGIRKNILYMTSDERALFFEALWCSGAVHPYDSATGIDALLIGDPRI